MAIARRPSLLWWCRNFGSRRIAGTISVRCMNRLRRGPLCPHTMESASHAVWISRLISSDQRYSTRGTLSAKSVFLPSFQLDMPDLFDFFLCWQCDHPIVHIAIATPKRMPNGSARNCRPRPSGNLPRAVACRMLNSLGVRSSRQTAGTDGS